jgi:hypothetical protein
MNGKKLPSKSRVEDGGQHDCFRLYSFVLILAEPLEHLSDRVSDAGVIDRLDSKSFKL